MNPFTVFERWLAWLDSDEGLDHRARSTANGEDRNESDLVALIPTPPGQSVFTMRDLRALVAAGREWAEAKSGATP